MHPITPLNINEIQNASFRNYASIYLEIADSFQRAIEKEGMAFEKYGSSSARAKALREHLASMQCLVRNCGASLVSSALSPACEACTIGVTSATYYISLKCHRKCFFCFNPNQENYQEHLSAKRDWRSELDNAKAHSAPLRYIALTGGEPLLFPDESIEFFKKARDLFPDSHLRLYTSGDQLDHELCQDLLKAGLDEIRFSVKTSDSPAKMEEALARIAMAKTMIPRVIVEMPVIPGQIEEMKDLLVQLDDARIDCINLLELGYPLYNAEEFSKRGLLIKNPPYETYYNYWYAGGIPIAESEVDCLKLLKYALENELSMGVHYCSLANKQFAQFLQQNSLYRDDTGTLSFSKKDFLLKTVKAFGSDMEIARKALEQAGERYIANEERQFIQFHPRAAKLLPNDMELGLSYQVFETGCNSSSLRELRVDVTHAGDDDLADI